MSFPRYPAYKPSGVEWLGPVPEHWQMKKMRHLSEAIEQGWSPQCENEPSKGDSPGVLKVGCVNGGRFRPMENKRLPDEIEPVLEYAIKRGDLLVSRANTRELVGCAAVALQDYPWLFICDKIYRLTLKTEEAIPSHVAAYLSSRQARGQIELGATGASQSMQNISQDVIRNLSIPLPCVKEQQAIANFLDRETAKIDALIAEQQCLIELLQEKRQSVISHAVTKGLNPNAPMKDSGVEWLGEVPEHWSMKRLKHISPNLTVGIVVNPSSYVSDDGLPFIYGGDIREGAINWQASRRIKAKHSGEQAKTRLVAGDLLMVRVGAPGVTAVVPVECEGGNCASVMLIRRGDFSSSWLCYALNTRIVRFQVEVVQYGAAQEQFNIGHAVDFCVPVPPRKEQEEIALALACRTQAIDTLIDQSGKGISLLQERRSALISSAVTGHIDVRGLVEAETGEQ